MDNIERKVITLLRKNQGEKAEQLLLPLITKNPTNHKLYHLYGLSASFQANYMDALKRFKHVISLEPNIAEYHHNIAATYFRIGEFDNAIAHYQNAIQLKPDYAEAYFNYVGTKKFTPDDPSIQKIETLIANKKISKEDKSFLGFAAGKIFNDTKEYDKAFKYYAIGNEALDFHFDIVSFRSKINTTIKIFNRDFISKFRDSGLKSKLPVFVVGMPRSGTTLVEQILSSHEDMFGAGELWDISGIANTMVKRINPEFSFPQGMTEVPGDFFAGYADAYLRKLRTYDHSAYKIIDKMTDNFLYLGLITIMFPRAKIIHCKRDPVDTCLSCYFQRFNNSHAYSTKLEILGLYYREYKKLMMHWEKIMPDKIHNVDYSEMILNQEKTTREIIEYCGLDWDPACLSFHKNPRPVTTASSWQVRNPIYKSSLQRWRNYEKHLDPLLKILNSGKDSQK